MWRTLWGVLLVLIMFTALGVGFAPACTNGDDDDDDEATDDDAADLDCQSAYDYLYQECGIELSDDAGEPIDVETLVTWCESTDEQYGDYSGAIFDCIRDHYGVCEDVQECFDGLPTE